MNTVKKVKKTTNQWRLVFAAKISAGNGHRHAFNLTELIHFQGCIFPENGFGDLQFKNGSPQAGTCLNYSIPPITAD
ncbi:hypothetical protein [uncultured Acetobacterium sp.]|uniref:hypothetical protein n=1 Tax=uncultured Acetobacterium sp. TaxID=217139 RepID=UPI0025D78926|nr:hypothetical protein [uncultured Acetobacterium sp.]